MKNLGRLASLASLATITLATQPFLATSAHAQNAQRDEEQPVTAGANVGDIVVTGRVSTDTSNVQIKHAAAAIVDSITAEEIARTTDTTLPEALDRVVGVSSDAFYGTSDAGYVSIRGFDSRYNSMDIDGNPIWFSSQNNRGAQTNMFPAAIVKETSVYKTVLPEMDHNAVGGHISLRTLRAFDGGSKPYLTVGGRGGFYDQDSRINPGASGSLYFAGKNTFGPDKKFGIVFGFNTQRYSNSDVYGGVDGYTQANGQDQVSSYLYADSAYDKRTRNTAVYAKAEMQATDKLYAFVSGNVFDESRRQYLQRTAIYIAATGGRTITQTGQGTADFTNGQGQIREYDYDIQRRAKVLGSGLEYAFSDRTAMTLGANYTDFFNDVLLRNPNATLRLSGINGSYNISGTVPTVTLANPAAYADASKWNYQNPAASSSSAAYVRDQILRDKVYSARALLRHNNQESARGFGAAAGVNWTRLDRSFDQDQTYYALASGSPSFTLATVAPAGATMAGNDAARMNYDAFWALLYRGNKRLDSAPTTDYALVEDTLAGHAALYWNGDSVHLTAALRYEQTYEDIHTANLVGGVVTPVHHKVDYGNWLPNIQGRWDVTSRLRLRAAFTKTIGRPDFADYAPGLTTTFDSNGVPVNNGTNPNLGPRVSTNYDASIEYYLRDGILALALFHKDIAGETFDQRTEIRDASGQLTQIDTIPLNTGSARVTGIEATVAKRHLDFLPGALARLGFQGNFTWLDGTWDVVFTDGSTRSVGGLHNQPRWLANLQGSYDAGPVTLNVNYRMRGRTFTGTFGADATGDRWIDGYDSLDAKLSLSLMREVSVSLEARNLTNSYIRQTAGAYDSIYNTVGAGRSYFAGLRFRY